MEISSVHRRRRSAIHTPVEIEEIEVVLQYAVQANPHIYAKMSAQQVIVFLLEDIFCIP